MKRVSRKPSLGVAHATLWMDALKTHVSFVETLCEDRNPRIPVNRIEKYFCARKRTGTLTRYHEESAIVSCRQKFKTKTVFHVFYTVFN